MKFLVLLLCIIHATVGLKNQTAKPIVLWHGIGDTCCLPIRTGLLRVFLYNQLPGVYIHSIDIGNNSFEALENSYFLNPNEQVEYACRVVRVDPNLQNGFNMIGLGQGSLFLRAVIQRCGHSLPPIKNFISFGGPHQGVSGLPRCTAVSHRTCFSIRELLQYAAYYRVTQYSLVQATYWHNPLHEDEYKKKSIFLADINNEGRIKKIYRSNLRKLEHFVMVKFDDDGEVEPRESEWFGFYAPGQDKEMQTLQQSKIYLEDRLGLREMDRAGQLVFLSQPTDHLQFDESWFFKHIMPYLADYPTKLRQSHQLLN